LVFFVESGQKSRERLYLGLIIVLAVALISLTGMQGMLIGGNQQAAEQNVLGLYSVLTGSNPEIASIKEESGMYKALVKIPSSTGDPSYQEIYVTRDGRLLTDRLVSIEEYKDSLLRSKNFTQCLYDRGVTIVGLSSNNYTVMQVQLLGDFGSRLFFDCSSNMEVCQQLNISVVPSIIYNNTVYEGLKTVGWFEETTGCKVGT
jgi:hypothetical protein